MVDKQHNHRPNALTNSKQQLVSFIIICDAVIPIIFFGGVILENLYNEIYSVTHFSTYKILHYDFNLVLGNLGSRFRVYSRDALRKEFYPRLTLKWEKCVPNSPVWVFPWFCGNLVLVIIQIQIRPLAVLHQSYCHKKQLIIVISALFFLNLIILFHQ